MKPLLAALAFAFGLCVNVKAESATFELPQYGDIMLVGSGSLYQATLSYELHIGGIDSPDDGWQFQAGFGLARVEECGGAYASCARYIRWHPSYLYAGGIDQVGFGARLWLVGSAFELEPYRLFVTVPDGVSLAPVPIPAALPLMASVLGLAGLIGWRRRRRS